MQDAAAVKLEFVSSLWVFKSQTVVISWNRNKLGEDRSKSEKMAPVFEFQDGGSYYENFGLNGQCSSYEK